ncbi:MAG: hypothetical protein ACJ75J_00545 [Cytophagaceae bacterium]
MKGVLTALLVGTAIAGIIYYLKDNGMIERKSRKLRKGSSYIYEQMKEEWNADGKEVTNALSEQP